MVKEFNVRRWLSLRYFSVTIVTVTVILLYASYCQIFNNTFITHFSSNTGLSFTNKNVVTDFVNVSSISFTNTSDTGISIYESTAEYKTPRKQQNGSNVRVGWDNFKPRRLALWKQQREFGHRMTNMARHSLMTLNFQANPYDRNVYDIMNMKPIKFDTAYKNPCWLGTGDNGPLDDGKLHCLPYFYIIGVKKSGTSDVYSRVMHHPAVVNPGFKESQWLSRLRFGQAASTIKSRLFIDILRSGVDIRGVGFFVHLFDKAAAAIDKLASLLRAKRTATDTFASLSRDTSPDYNKFVTAEASPSLFHMHTNWEHLPGNEGLPEPRYTNFHYLKHLTPDAKIIVIFRDPVTRLYSDFLHTTHALFGKHSPQLFHAHTTKLVETYNTCFELHSMRSCIYNNSMKETLMRNGIKLAESFHAGFYAFFMREVYSVFHKGQVMPVLMSDYINSTEHTLRKIFEFLELAPLSRRKMDRIRSYKIKNAGTYTKRRAGEMKEETKVMLKSFYNTYNMDMSVLMNDTGYLFK